MTGIIDKITGNGNGATGDFNAVMIGAGFAMFGTDEGPWNISRRLETRVGDRLRVQAIIEVDPPRAEACLKQKLADPKIKAAYENTVILSSIADFKSKVDAGELKNPKAIFVATPPQFRGGLQSFNDIEVQLDQLFPDAHIFLEKPVATGSEAEKSIEEAKKVGEMLKKHQGNVSIGYVLRYLAAVKMMKKIIEDNNLTVMATMGKYVVAYELAIKTDWWNKSKVQGPVIEQATHICDLSRYIGGDIDIDSVSAHAVEAHEKPGVLSKKNFDESVIPDEQRIPRATSANWKYTNGAVGSLLHAIALHGVNYSIELQVYADGYQLVLVDPYGEPQLHVRRPGSDEYEVIPTPGDDPYQTEMNHFIDTIEGGENPEILSTYEDAAKTYEFTWAIRQSSEESTKKQLAKYGKAV